MVLLGQCLAREETTCSYATLLDFHVMQAAEWDRGHIYPAEAVRQMADMGLMGVAIPEEEGGTGLDYLTYALAIEEISRGCTW